MKRRVIILVAIIGLVGAIAAGCFYFLRDTSQTAVEPPRQTYIALGDSVAAGVGLATDTDSSACDRTDESYPKQLGKALNYNAINLACSGATLPNGILGPQDVNRLAVPAQLQQLPGKSRPTLITLTVGANDAGWTEFIGRCYVAVCGSAQDTATVASRLDTVRQNLRTTFDQLRQQYGSSVPRTVVVGYYQVFPTISNANCVDLAAIDANELAWGRRMQSSINTALRETVADYDFVRYAEPDFSGHELCTTDAWVQGLNAPQPYHPTAAGQSAIAKTIEAVVR